MKRLKQLLIRWLCGDLLEQYDGRIKDLERHFVTRRDREGMAVETLADVPLEKRKEIKPRQAGLSWHQRRAYLEATDGERRAPVAERIESTS